MMSRSIAVLGGGCFGTAIANVLAGNGHSVTLWMRDKALSEKINQSHVNEQYLPDITLNDNLVSTVDMESAVRNVEIVVIAVPSKSVREVCHSLHSLLDPAVKPILVTTTKGIENNPFKLMSDVINEELPGYPLVVLSGPNLAKEISKRSITGTVVASQDEEVCSIIQKVFSCDYFRVYSNPDVYGVELGGALKNIYAVAIGMLNALGFGENAKALLITRGLAEMSRFAAAMGANPLTFLGLGGVGDLIVTCSSSLSRNFQVGYFLGKGETLEEALRKLGQTAEGINTLAVVAEKARAESIYMPIVFGLNAIIFEKAEVGQVLTDLMHGEHAQDVEFISNKGNN